MAVSELRPRPTPTGGAQVIAGYGFRKLSRPGHLEPYFRALATSLVALHGHEAGELLKIKDPNVLYRQIAGELDVLLAGVAVSFQPGGPLAKLQGLALKEGRSFYVPRGNPPFIYVSGQPPVEGAQVFEVNPVQFGEVRDPAIGESSIIVTPILTRGHEAGGAEVFVQRGIMTVEKNGPDAFEPTVHIEFLRAVSDDVARVLARLGIVAAK